MATSTPFLGLRKPTNVGGVSNKGDPIDVVADISNNMDDIDDFASDTDARFGSTTNAEHTGGGTLTSTSFVETLTGGTPASMTFIAPPSGKVVVGNNSHCDNSGAFRTTCGFILRTGGTIGSGTTVYDTGEGLGSVFGFGTDELHGSASKQVNGLTPGATYNLRQQFKVTGGTGTCQDGELIIQPGF